MTYLLHAITRTGAADAPPGLRGAPLEFITAGPLGAWATRDPSDSGTREDAFEHHRVVEDICAAQPCLPVRLGTRLPDADAVRALIAARVEELLLTLERVGGRRELAVTLLWPDSGVERGREHTPVQARTPGRAFLERKQSDQAVDDARLATAERLARALETGLATEQSDVRHAMCPSSKVALSTAVLARAGEADALKERAVEIVSGLEGVRGVVSGPWPPYTFAGTP